MANDINQVTISGAMSGEPQFKPTSNGSLVCRFSLKCEERRPMMGTDVKVEHTVAVVCFKDQATDIQSKGLKTGSRVCVSGKLAYSEWTAMDGSKRTRLEVVGFQVIPIATTTVKKPQTAQVEEEPWTDETGTPINHGDTPAAVPSRNGPMPAGVGAEGEDDTPF